MRSEKPLIRKCRQDAEIEERLLTPFGMTCLFDWQAGTQEKSVTPRRGELQEHRLKPMLRRKAAGLAGRFDMSKDPFAFRGERGSFGSGILEKRGK